MRCWNRVDPQHPWKNNLSTF
ncbi:hypothetical protein GCQ56_09500 [Marinifilum sp. N1E240]|nr:hypothetical protein [Marinifilum sp. N1E240]